MNEKEALGRLFVETSRERLRRNTSKLLRCLSLLPEERMWARQNEHVNSVGNLVLHLCGNVRQWIISGIGGVEDSRRRSEEFDVRAFAPKEALQAMVEKTGEEADRALAELAVERLSQVRTIQGFQVTCLEAIYSAVEHWSHHVGQIIYITKVALRKDLAFTRLTPDGDNPD